MASAPSPVRLEIGDPMPRIVLPLAAGGLFDSWDQTAAGQIQIYWQDAASAHAEGEALATTLIACEAEMRVVAPAPPGPETVCGRPWLVDKTGDLGRALGDGPLGRDLEAARLAAEALPPQPPGMEQMAVQLQRPSFRAVDELIDGLVAQAAILTSDLPATGDLLGRPIQSELSRHGLP